MSNSTVTTQPATSSAAGRAPRLLKDLWDDAEAAKLGPPQFEEAARALLAISPTTETALELMRHRLQAVRGRAVLDCMAHAEQGWAKEALAKGAKKPK